MSIYNIFSIFTSGFCSAGCLYAVFEGKVCMGVLLGILAICDLLCGIFIIKRRGEE